jgi:hypothetical protein
MNILKELNHLQTIIMKTPPPPNLWPPLQQRAQTDRVKDEWIELAKQILIHIQRRDNLEKTVVVQDYDGNERRILLTPKSLFEEDGRYA